MPGLTSADKVARWPAPVILSASTGSFASIAASTTRRPPGTMSWILANAPLGKELEGHGTSWSIEALSSVPKRSGCFATTTVCDATVVLFASRLFARTFAWLLSQTWAINTAIKPKTTANPIMTMVLARTTQAPFGATEISDGLFVRNTRDEAVLNY